MRWNPLRKTRDSKIFTGPIASTATPPADMGAVGDRWIASDGRCWRKGASRWRRRGTIGPPSA